MPDLHVQDVFKMQPLSSESTLKMPALYIIKHLFFLIIMCTIYYSYLMWEPKYREVDSWLFPLNPSFVGHLILTISGWCGKTALQLVWHLFPCCQSFALALLFFSPNHCPDASHSHFPWVKTFEPRNDAHLLIKGF